MFEIYEALKSDINFEANVINWMGADLPNPFKEGTPERELYFKAKKCYRRWRAGGIDSRSGKKYMFEYIKRLMALDIPNPYEKEPLVQVTITPEEELEEQPKKILGVLPDKKKSRLSFFKKDGGKNDSQRSD